MKVFVCLLAVIITLATVSGQGYGGSSGGGGVSGSSYSGSSGGGGGGSAYGGSSGGGGFSGSSGGVGGGNFGISKGVAGGHVSIPAPLCTKNYLFGCHPSLAAVPCTAPVYGSAGYGSVGAYSENVPTILKAPYGYPGVPVPGYYGNN